MWTFFNTLEKRRLLHLATVSSIVVAVTLIIVKIGGWLMTGSLSLQASLMDSLLDAVASCINFYAVRLAYLPADGDHKFGHGKAEALAALGQAIFIAGSALFLMVEARHRFLNPPEVTQTGLGVAVMIFAIILTAFLISFQSYVVKQTGSSAIAADRLHYRSDLLVNFTVIVSLVSSHLFDMKQVDAIAGAFIALYIFKTSWAIARHGFDVIMDKEIPFEKKEIVRAIVGEDRRILNMTNLRTRSSGPHDFIQFDLSLPATLTLQEATAIAQEIEQKIVAAIPQADVTIQKRPIEV